jgi:phage-related protein (TIGR01555 family)
MISEDQTKIVVLSALLERERLSRVLGMQFNGNRDMYGVLGYPQVISFEQYDAEYRRSDMAARVIDLPASDTWRVPPTIQDGPADTTTAFTKELKILIQRLRVWHYLERLDRLAGIGRFGILLLGVRDGRSLREPLIQGALRTSGDVLYLSVFSEGSTTILTFDKDNQSPRFGLPETYQVQMGSNGLGFGTEVIHWSRIIHAAEGLGEDEVFGQPRLERIYNRLQDMMKVVGGGAEAAWRVMDRGLHADVRDGFTLKNTAAVNDELEEYLHGMRRFIRTEGMDIHTLGAETVDPTGMFNVLVNLIAAATNIPKRILIGAERGELASGQDAAQWAGQIRSRRLKFAEPLLLRPFIDRLVWAGALPEATGSQYTITWTPLFELDEMQHGQVADAYARAIAVYAPGGATDTVVPVGEFREKWLGLPKDLPEVLAGKDQAVSLQEVKVKAEIMAALTSGGADLLSAATVAGFTPEQAKLLQEAYAPSDIEQ